VSRVRTRPTRDDTREKLFEAAARVFEEQGIGGASIEAIAAAAGLTRGAFYSNFKSKDELIIAMLEDHVEQSIRRNLDLLARHKNLADFIEALRTMDRSRQDPVCGACRKAQTGPRQAPASQAKTGHRYRRDHVEEQREDRIPESNLDR